MSKLIDICYPETDDTRIIRSKYHEPDQVHAVLSKLTQAEFSKDFPAEFPPIFHQFCEPDKGVAPLETLRTLAEIRDHILYILHETERALFYDREHLENVFLMWRFLIIYEGLFEPPPAVSEEAKKALEPYLKAYNPFLFYRDIWEALLHPYWQEKSLDSVRAEHFRNVIAEYFAQLLPAHPCKRITCEAAKHKPCSCCKHDGNKECDSTFPQEQCDRTVSPALIAAFADCIWRHAATEIKLIKKLLDAIFNALGEDSISKLHISYPYAFWYFFTDFLDRQTAPNTLQQQLKKHILKEHDSLFEKKGLPSGGWEFTESLIASYRNILGNVGFPNAAYKKLTVPTTMTGCYEQAIAGFWQN